MDAGRESLERAYREEATRIRAALAARTGDVGLAEDAVQDAFVEAIEHWARDGVPAEPGRLAGHHRPPQGARPAPPGQGRRGQAGAARRDRGVAAARTAGRRPRARWTPGREAAEDDGEADRQADDELLSLAFACCHPALATDAQVALTLRAVCGLTTGQIAAAFLVSEATMAQRLLRARKTLSALRAPVTVPDPDELAGRLAQVLAVVYLVFNEGYLASSGREPARRDLAAQAIALTRTLHRLMPREPEVLGLLALLLLHESRARARFDGWGRLIRLKDQDRAEVGQAAGRTRRPAHLDRAIALRRSGPYQVQAAIAALHARGAVLRGDRLAADPAALQPPAAARPVPGGAAEPGGRHPVRDRRASRRWPRSSPCQPISTATTCSTRCGRPCWPPSAATPRRPGPRASARRWPPTRPSATCSPAASRCTARGATPVPPGVRLMAKGAIVSAAR